MINTKKGLDPIAKQVYKMFSFQYKPLEKLFYKFCTENNQPQLIKQFKTTHYLRKIEILDNFANYLKLN